MRFKRRIKHIWDDFFGKIIIIIWQLILLQPEVYMKKRPPNSPPPIDNKPSFTKPSYSRPNPNNTPSMSIPSNPRIQGPAPTPTSAFTKVAEKRKKSITIKDKDGIVITNETVPPIARVYGIQNSEPKVKIERPRNKDQLISLKVLN